MPVLRNKAVFVTASVALLSVIILVSTASTANSGETKTGFDSITVLLSYKKIPSGDFIHLYDSFPSRVPNAHLAVKVKCDEDSNGIVSIIVGVAPDMEVIDLTTKNLVYELFTPAKICVYHMHLPQGDRELTDIGLINTSNEPVRLGPTATVLIHIHG
ncbi:MAG: hypothetical protein ACE5KA_06005 [Nitrososphaerales archaeon]